MSKSPITTHILDLHRGVPAGGVTVRLAHLRADGTWHTLGAEVTDDDGRANGLMTDAALNAGTYRLTFEVGGYFVGNGQKAFFPSVEVRFLVEDAGRHYHVPLLLSPFGYSTYRGS